MIKVTFFSICLCMVSSLKAQYNDTILKALQDELTRNKQELQYEDYQKPFFIAYTLYDQRYAVSMSSLGGNIFNIKKSNKGGNTRLIIGDYTLSDELFSDNTTRVNHNDGYIALPQKVDYEGIRRHYWLTTNNLYKNATEKYENKLAALKQQNLTKEELPANDFSQEVPRQLVVKDSIVVDNANLLNDMSIRLSDVFNQYPDIIDSKVIINSWVVTHYYVNTEGSQIVLPKSLITILVSAGVYTPENIILREALKFTVNSMEDLPEEDEIAIKINEFANNLLQKGKLNAWTDTYSGPVLMEDQAFYQLLLKRIFVPKSGLIAKRLSLIKDSKKGVYLSVEPTLESRIDKKVSSTMISMYDIPFLKEYNQIKLIGNYQIDCEGVLPTDTLTLIEKGYLKSLYTNRTPLKTIENSNGHFRTTYNRNGCSRAIAPGIVKIEADKTLHKKELINNLVSMAKEEGLDFAIIARPAIKGDLISPINFYKIDLLSGKETLIRGIKTTNIGMRTYKDIVDVSDTKFVLNDLFSYRVGKKSSAAIPSSFIYPSFILLSDIDINGTNKPLQKNAPIIPNPL